MRLIATSYYGGLRAVGVPAIRRRLKDAGLILCYHDVVADSAHDGGCPGVHESRDRFERQMRWLAAHYRTVGLDEFLERLTSGAALRSIATVTFDDGYRGVFEEALPVLERLGIPATVFVVADAVGSLNPFSWDGSASYFPADWDQIRRAAARGVEIGAHSASHPSLPTLSDAELRREIVASRETIRAATGVAPRFFAYPFGHWNDRVRDAVNRAGFAAAVTLDFGLNGRRADPWTLRRINMPAGISEAAFEAWTSGTCGRSALFS